MKLYESQHLLFAVNDRGKVAPVVNDPASRRHALEPETFLRMAFNLAWTDPEVYGQSYDEAVATQHLRWERPDPKFRLYKCPNEHVVFDYNGDVAVVERHEKPIYRLWEDPREFLDLHIRGMVAWVSSWEQEHVARNYYRNLASQSGRLLWELTL